MRTSTTASIRRGVVAALVCLSFVLQQTLIPLHLSLNEHTTLGSGAPGTHVGAGHAPGDVLHAHAYEGVAHTHTPDDPDGGHDPHPAEDHLEQGIGELVLPLLGELAAVPPQVTVELPFDVTPPSAPVRRESSRPPSPPPRGPTAPRAPPATV